MIQDAPRIAKTVNIFNPILIGIHLQHLESCSKFFRDYTGFSHFSLTMVSSTELEFPLEKFYPDGDIELPVVDLKDAVLKELDFLKEETLFIFF